MQTPIFPEIDFVPFSFSVGDDDGVDTAAAAASPGVQIKG